MISVVVNESDNVLTTFLFRRKNKPHFFLKKKERILFEYYINIE